MDTLKTLKSSEVFSNLSDGVLLDIAHLTHKRQFIVGEHLVHEGDLPGACFLIISGSVEVYRDIGFNKKLILGELGANAILGELSVIDGLPRSASVIALEDTETLAIEEPDFKQMLLKDPTIAMMLLPILANLLRKTQDELYLASFVQN